MTREEILAMEPGLDLDILVAEKIFNAKVRDDSYADYWFEEGEPMTFSMEGFETRFKPSTDISAAWEVVEKMSYEKVECVFDLELRYKGYWAIFNCEGKKYESTQQKSAPEAICKCSLLAVMDL